MAIQNLPTMIAKPRTWAASVGNGDASAWKLLLSQTGGGGGANGSKITSVRAASTDSAGRVLQLARARLFTGPTITIASPGVVSWAQANGNNAAVGDQVMFLNNGDTLPTGLAFNTTYFIISAGFTLGASFQLAASAGGTAINTSVSQSGNHQIALIKPLAAQTVAITSGTDGATPTADLLGLDAAEAIDQDGQKYILLDTVDYLAVSCTSTVTANKMLSVHADGGDF